MKIWKKSFIVILTICVIIATACTPKKSETQSVQNEYDKITDADLSDFAGNLINEETEFQPPSQVSSENLEITEENTFDFENILRGDLSDFAGMWWENESGESKMQLATVLQDRPFSDGYAIDGFGFHKGYGYYYWNQFHINEGEYEIYFIFLSN